MTLMIFDTLPLEALISSMDATIELTALSPVLSRLSTAETTDAASLALPELQREIDEISSVDDDTSSIAAACSEAVDASEPLDDDNCDTALWIPSAPAETSCVMRRNCRLSVRTRNRMIVPAITVRQM